MLVAAGQLDAPAGCASHTSSAVHQRPGSSSSTTSRRTSQSSYGSSGTTSRTRGTTTGSPRRRRWWRSKRAASAATSSGWATALPLTSGSGSRQGAEHARGRPPSPGRGWWAAPDASRRSASRWRATPSTRAAWMSATVVGSSAAGRQIGGIAAASAASGAVEDRVGDGHPAGDGQVALGAHARRDQPGRRRWRPASRATAASQATESASVPDGGSDCSQAAARSAGRRTVAGRTVRRRAGAPRWWTRWPWRSGSAGHTGFRNAALESGRQGGVLAVPAPQVQRPADPRCDDRRRRAGPRGGEPLVDRAPWRRPARTDTRHPRRPYREGVTLEATPELDTERLKFPVPEYTRRMALDPKKWTLKTQEAMAAAIDQAKANANPELTPDHLLAALTRQDDTVVGPVLGQARPGPADGPQQGRRGRRQAAQGLRRRRAAPQPRAQRTSSSRPAVPEGPARRLPVRRAPAAGHARAPRRRHRGAAAGAAGGPRLAPRHVAEPRGAVPGARALRPGPHGPRPRGQDRPGHRTRRRDPPGHPGALAADEEQPRADRRARRRQDRHRRGPRPAHRRRRRARGPEEQAPRSPSTSAR